MSADSTTPASQNVPLSLQRAAQLLEPLWIAWCEETCSRHVTTYTVEMDKNGKLFVDFVEKQGSIARRYGGKDAEYTHPIYEFRPKRDEVSGSYEVDVEEDEKVRRAIVAYYTCEETFGLFPLIYEMFNGEGRQVQQVNLEVDPFLPIDRTHRKIKQACKNCHDFKPLAVDACKHTIPHSLFLVTIDGITYTLDLSGAQFGQEFVVGLWQDYEYSKIAGAPSEGSLKPISESKTFILEKSGATSFSRRGVLDKLRLRYVEWLQSGATKGLEAARGPGKTWSDLLEQPTQEEFEMARKRIHRYALAFVKKMLEETKAPAPGLEDHIKTQEVQKLYDRGYEFAKVEAMKE